MALSSSQLEAFYALAQTRNFTRAAERLRVTQSALSQRILNLESELETTLFIRDRAGILLTEPAQELLRYCQSKNALEGEFLSHLRAGKKGALAGWLRIAGFSSVMPSVILPALAPLLAENPDVRILVLVREIRDLPGLLQRGEADFIILDRAIEREDLVSHELGSERNVLVEKRGYSGPEIYLDHDEEDEVTLRYLKLARKRAGKIERRYLDDVHGILAGTRLGLGRAVVPLHLVRNDRELRVVDGATVLSAPIYLHYHAQPYYSRLHLAVSENLIRSCRKLLD